jgi:hypothetical protein
VEGEIGKGKAEIGKGPDFAKATSGKKVAIRLYAALREGDLLRLLAPAVEGV